MGTPAGAATLVERDPEMAPRQPWEETFTTLHYVASPGERNRVRISPVGDDDILLSDRGARSITVRAPSCRDLSPRRVRCAGSRVAFLGIGLHGGADRAFGSTFHNTSVFGGSGSDVISVRGAHAEGGSGNDRIFGSAGEDILSGGPGDDVLMGRGDDDSLYGEAGNDRIDVRNRGRALGTLDCGPGLDALIVDDPRDGFGPHRCERVATDRRARRH